MKASPPPSGPRPAAPKYRAALADVPDSVTRNALRDTTGRLAEPPVACGGGAPAPAAAADDEAEADGEVGARLLPPPTPPDRGDAFPCTPPWCAGGCAANAAACPINVRPSSMAAVVVVVVMVLERVFCICTPPTTPRSRQRAYWALGCQ